MSVYLPMKRCGSGAVKLPVLAPDGLLSQSHVTSYLTRSAKTVIIIIIIIIIIR